MAELTLKFSTLSRNAIIKECINTYDLDPKDRDQEIYELRIHINALYIQANPDWKRKKSLPFHDEELYKPVANFQTVKDEQKFRKSIGVKYDRTMQEEKSNLPPIGGDE